MIAVEELREARGGRHDLVGDSAPMAGLARFILEAAPRQLDGACLRRKRNG